MDKDAFARRLIGWYDENARQLPWRVRGAHPAPYHVYLSEIMLQQTVVKTVIPYFLKFIRQWPRIEDLAAADLDDVLRAWAGLGYYARARNLHACARAVAERHGGRFPDDEAALLALPGIGPYTAAAIRAIGFDKQATVVDGNVERVVARVFAITAPLPGAKPEIRAKAGLLTPARRPGDYAQAMMDLGATVCTPTRPDCRRCPVATDCAAFAENCAEALPAREAKKTKPLRTGTAFLAVRADGAVLLRRRPDKGLLAKMLEVPSTPWLTAEVSADPPAASEPIDTDWQPLAGTVRHTFTHFELRLVVNRAFVGADAELLPAADSARCRWVARRDLAGEALPTVMRKILAHGLDG